MYSALLIVVVPFAILLATIKANPHRKSLAFTIPAFNIDGSIIIFLFYSDFFRVFQKQA